MLRPAQLFRLVHINWVLVRHGLDEIIFAAHLLRPLRFLFALAPWRWWKTPERRAARGERIRRALEDLGPIFIKFGQILSTRRDLLPDDIAIELARLQDRVPPFPVEAARATVERSLGRPIDELFTEFDDQPLASASIAQVHAARLVDGREVVVKVLRPNIERIIRRDVGLLYIVADLAQKYWSEGPRLRPHEVVSEYEKTILDELDLIREAANATQLRRNFIDSESLYVPEVMLDLCRRDVLVMERIHGIPVSDLARLRSAGINIRRLSERGVEIFFTQVFRHNFFHADMHPGNIFVDPHRREDPQYIAVDFGIVGTLSPDDQRYLAGNFLAFFQRDYRRVAELHVDSGWVPEGTRIDEFESAIRTVCEPIFERPLKEISFGQLLLRLFQTARRFDMQVQPQLVLLQKTLLNIEGLGRQLYPDLDLWRTAKPFLEQWMKDQVGLKARARQLRQRLPEWGEVLPELPVLAHELMQQARAGRLRLRLQSDDLKHLSREIRRANRRSVGATLGAAFIIGAALVYGLDGLRPPLIAGAPVWTWVMGAIGLLLVGRALAADD